MVEKTKVYLPDVERHEKYMEVYSRYRRVYDAVRGLLECVRGGTPAENSAVTMKPKAG